MSQAYDDLLKAVLNEALLLCSMQIRLWHASKAATPHVPLLSTPYLWKLQLLSGRYKAATKCQPGGGLPEKTRVRVTGWAPSAITAALSVSQDSADSKGMPAPFAVPGSHQSEDNLSSAAWASQGSQQECPQRAQVGERGRR